MHCCNLSRHLPYCIFIAMILQYDIYLLSLNCNENLRLFQFTELNWPEFLYYEMSRFQNYCMHIAIILLHCNIIAMNENIHYWASSCTIRSWSVADQIFANWILSLTLYYITKWWYYDIMRFFQADSTRHGCWCCQPEKISWYRNIIIL